MSLFEVTTTIPSAMAERVSEFLAEAGDATWSVCEDVGVQRARLIGIFACEAEARQRSDEMLDLLRSFPLGAPAVRELGEAEWRESYRMHFHAWQFGRLHWVPIWEREKFVLPDGDVVLWLDPGLAFGTGNHETTRLCVERLVERAERDGVDGKVVDAGCGSGILALSAARLGFREAVGFDFDPEAVRVSAENATSNDLAGRVNFFVGDLASGLAGVQAEVLMANILGDVLMKFARELTAAVACGGTLILSGILASELGKLREVFGALVPQWRQDTRTMGEWSDLVLRRPKE